MVLFLFICIILVIIYSVVAFYRNDDVVQYDQYDQCDQYGVVKGGINYSFPEFEKSKYNRKDLFSLFKEYADGCVGCVWSMRDRDNNVSRYSIKNENLDGILYFGRTEYNGDKNRNGKRSVDFILSDGSTKLCTLDRKLWNRYEKEVGKDGCIWMGLVYGDYVEIRVFPGSLNQRVVNYEIYDAIKWRERNAFKEKIEVFLSKVYHFSGDEIRVERCYDDCGRSYDCFETYYLAGARYYTDKCLLEFGYTMSEPSNPYDKNAIAVYTLNGKHVGYIPRESTQHFRKTYGTADDVPLLIYVSSSGYGRIFTFIDSMAEYESMAELYMDFFNPAQLQLNG